MGLICLDIRMLFRVSVRGVIYALVLLMGSLAGCGAPPSGDATYIATIPPAGAILNELIRGRATVSVLVPPGASPHAYSLRPSDVRQAASALAVFFVDSHLDGWAASLGARTQVSLFELVPPEFRRGGDGHSEAVEEEKFNPHFWPDPLAVRAILPHLVEALSALDPEGSKVYEQNGQVFEEALTRLDEEIRDVLSNAVPSSVVVFHPSWNYYLERYGISVVATIEPLPGHEPTPRRIQQIFEAIRSENVRAVLTESQLPNRPAEVVAENSDVKIVEIDPIGGVDGRKTYEELLRYNTRVLEEALR
jgi:zinc transport system substrate-binding protein